MSRSRQKISVVLALAAIAVVLFGATAELLPHHHDNVTERVCPICHAPLIGLGVLALKLPSLTSLTWTVNSFRFLAFVSSPIRHTSPRAPPAS